MKLGASKNKVVLGIPTYGRSFTLTSSTNVHPPNAYFTNGGSPGPILNQVGFLGYQEICLFMNNEGWSKIDDINGPYAYKGNQWVGFDNIESAQRKAQYVMDENLGGAMFWDTSTDDFNVSELKLFIHT